MTSFHGPINVYGERNEGANADRGDTVIVQSAKLQAATAAVVEAVFYLPPRAQILEFGIDNIVLWTATTAGLTIGSASAGAQYMASVDVKANGGRSEGAATLAQAAVMEALTTATAGSAVYATVTSTGPNAVGTTRVTMRYRML